MVGNILILYALMRASAWTVLYIGAGYINMHAYYEGHSESIKHRLVAVLIYVKHI